MLPKFTGKSRKFLPDCRNMITSIFLLPNISWLYNGVHLLILLAAWWCLREKNLLSPDRSVAGDILMYLILAQPLLLPFFQTVPNSDVSDFGPAVASAIFPNCPRVFIVRFAPDLCYCFVSYYF